MTRYRLTRNRLAWWCATAWTASVAACIASALTLAGTS